MSPIAFKIKIHKTWPAHKNILRFIFIQNSFKKKTNEKSILKEFVPRSYDGRIIVKIICVQQQQQQNNHVCVPYQKTCLLFSSDEMSRPESYIFDYLFLLLTLILSYSNILEMNKKKRRKEKKRKKSKVKQENLLLVNLSKY